MSLRHHAIIRDSIDRPAPADIRFADPDVVHMCRRRCLQLSDDEIVLWHAMFGDYPPGIEPARAARIIRAAGADSVPRRQKGAA